MTIRLMVTGCRQATNNDYKAVARVLDQIHSDQPVSELIHGACGHIDSEPGKYRGIDGLADQWAKERGILPTPYPADWPFYGNGAGPIRNQQMVDTKPDLVIAFYGGKGTADAVAKAKAAGITVREFRRVGKGWMEVTA